LQLPKAIRVGSKRYAIITQPHVLDSRHRALFGDINYNTSTIRVSMRHPKTLKPMTKRQQSYTFWHEMTHAILKDMHHSLEANEEFVDAFAIRLNDAIHNAKL
jgi:hypothetical protein